MIPFPGPVKIVPALHFRIPPGVGIAVVPFAEIPAGGRLGKVTLKGIVTVKKFFLFRELSGIVMMDVSQDPWCAEPDRIGQGQKIRFRSPFASLGIDTQDGCFGNA